MSNIDRTGIFRAELTECGVREPKPGAKSIMLGTRFKIIEALEDGEWVDWTEYDVEAFGDFNIIKKDGTINEGSCTQLRDVLGLNHDFEMNGDGHKCQITVKADTYEGKTKFRASWLDDWDREGGTGIKSAENPSNVLAPVQSQLKAFFGAKAVTTPAPTKAPPTAKAPPSGPPKAAPSGPPRSEKVVTSSLEQAWAYLTDLATKQGWDDDRSTKEWTEAIKKVDVTSEFGDGFTPEQWGVVEGHLLPF